MREIIDHKSGIVKDLSDVLGVFAMDERGPGNANHVYEIRVSENPVTVAASIKFQYGPLQENTPNGVSNEAVLAVVIDRLKGFQSGNYPCKENADALIKLEEAMTILHNRTKDRMMRKVEGTSNA